MSTDTVEIACEIRHERTLSLGIVPAAEIDPFRPSEERLVWLPKAEVILIHRNAGNIAGVEIPRWLAEKENLLAKPIEHDPNQGVLL